MQEVVSKVEVNVSKVFPNESRPIFYAVQWTEEETMLECIISWYLHSFFYIQKISMFVSLSQFHGILGCFCWEPALTSHRFTNKVPFLLLKTRLGSFNMVSEELTCGAAIGGGIWALGHVLNASSSTAGLSLLSHLERGAKHNTYQPWAHGWVHVSFHSPKRGKCFLCSPNYVSMYIKE